MAKDEVLRCTLKNHLTLNEVCTVSFFVHASGIEPSAGHCIPPTINQYQTAVSAEVLLFKTFAVTLDHLTGPRVERDLLEFEVF